MDNRVSDEARRRQDEVSRLAGRAAKEAGGPEPTKEEIVQALESAREALYRERYDTA
jgi:hypothetical protein